MKCLWQVYKNCTPPYGSEEFKKSSRGQPLNATKGLSKIVWYDDIQLREHFQEQHLSNINNHDESQKVLEERLVNNNVMR